MICVWCRKNDVRPPVCCGDCGRLVCEECRKTEWLTLANQLAGKSIGGSTSKNVARIVCKFCLAERELST